jgi:RNA polymerase sigma-70 factor (ECF subfamily)
VQDTLLTARQRFPQFRGTTAGELQAWLRQILRTTLANFARFHHADRRDVARDVPLEKARAHSPAHDLPGADPDPALEAARREEARRLEQALTRLPDRLARVVLLRHRENRSFQEIGEELGCSAESARGLWRAARKQLRRLLGPPGGTP